MLQTLESLGEWEVKVVTQPNGTKIKKLMKKVVKDKKGSE